MPKILIGPAVSKMEGSHAELKHLDKELAIEVEGSFWAKKHRPGWDGHWHPASKLTGRFPTGLLSRVRKLFPLAQIVETRVIPTPLPFKRDRLKGVILSDFQSEAVITTLKELIVTIGIAMAGGKTEVGIAIACHVPGRCVWISHRKDVFRDTAERIVERTGGKPVLVGEGIWNEDPDAKFMVVMPQTAQGDIDLFKQQVKGATVLILDEVHRTGAAATWYKLAKMVPAVYRVGLTGTPKTDHADRDLRLEAAAGPVVSRVTSHELAKMGWTTLAKVFFHKVPARDDLDLDDEMLMRRNYQMARKLYIEEYPLRNKMIALLAVDAAREGKRVLVITDTIKHARRLGEMFSSEENLRFKILTGKDSGHYRSEAKKGLRAGTLEVLLATPIFDEGVNIPELDVLILAAGGKSAVRFIQRVGRALRKAPGKKVAIIHDFFDMGNRYVRKHSRQRVATCREQKFAAVEEVDSSKPVRASKG